MRRHQIIVSLPPNWEEVPGDLRAYRRRGVQGGVLRLSLRPPIPDKTCGEAVASVLANSLKTIELDIGAEVTSVYGPTQMGITATNLRHSQSHGLLQIWLVAGDVTVFASYTMGQLAEARQDLNEAHEIVKTLKLVRVA
jgi:hypothetical protein